MCRRKVILMYIENLIYYFNCGLHEGCKESRCEYNLIFDVFTVWYRRNFIEICIGNLPYATLKQV